MKTNLKLLLATALLASACTTGMKVTSGGYTDDLYFTPGDAVPIAQKPVKEVKKPQQRSTVVMEVEENEQGKIVNNYVVPKSSKKDKNAYYFNDEPAYADTVFEYIDDKEHVTINNYYEGEEMDYSTRLRTFYNPYCYDPFWDPFWNNYYGSPFSWGLGWRGIYGGLYGGWYGGYYGGWYDYWYPGYYGYGYGLGWGGYYPYWGGYYAGWGGYYPGWGWTSGSLYPGGGYWGNGNYYAGKQNHTGKRGGSNAVRYGMNNQKSGNLMGSSFGSRMGTSRSANSNATRLPAGNYLNGSTGTRQNISGTGATGTRQINSRAANSQQDQSNMMGQGTRLNRGETISNLRRPAVSSNDNTRINSGNSNAGPVTSGREYTPTYSRPRMNTQATYNNSGTTRQYNATQSGNYSNSRYSRPQSSGSNSGEVRSQPNVTYQRGSASSAQSRSYSNQESGTRSSSPSNSGSSSSRSFTPSPSFNSGNMGGGSVGGGSVGGNSGGGSRSGGGGSGRTR